MTSCFKTAFMKTASLIVVAFSLTACATTPEPTAIQEPVRVEPVAVSTCTPKSQLTRVVIPAVYKEGFTINSIENTPEFITDPVTGEVREITAPSPQTKVPYKIVVEEERIIYKNAANVEVTDICADDTGSFIPNTPG